MSAERRDKCKLFLLGSEVLAKAGVSADRLETCPRSLQIYSKPGWQTAGAVAKHGWAGIEALGPNLDNMQKAFQEAKESRLDM